MTPGQLQTALTDAIHLARQVDLRRCEQEEAPRLLQESVPALRNAVLAGAQAMGSVRAHYEEDEDLPGFVADTRRQRIADLAFMARLDLGERPERLGAMTASEAPWNIIAMCSSARRRLFKCAAAVERALCAHEGLTPRLEGLLTQELERSLKVRQAYVLFRRGLLTRAEPTAPWLAPVLRRAAVCFSELTGREIYEDLRIEDRTELRRLQAAVLDWLRGQDGHDAVSGRRLWQDIAVFAELLTQVNLRPELREHDQALLGSLLLSLELDPSLSAERLAELAHPLLGVDDVLDDCIENPTAVERAEWRETLERLATNLLGEHGAMPPPEQEALAAPR
ncbi:hypothetical protein [Myxococcus sp. AB056]|uniref:hypothetical protein n=1 Tax=Myxococcus sp. AB056 TaxID=2562792 RepID=UPI0011468FF2|nr:hypothetical protein [Myxococcus sp. AB056]